MLKRIQIKLERKMAVIQYKIFSLVSIRDRSC